MQTLSQWLASIGLNQYEAAFHANDIDLEVLPGLTAADLEKLGVSMGHRKKLLKAIAGLGENAADDSAVAASDESPRDSSPEGEGERRQLTVLFCDMVGFTELASRFDPEVLRRVVRAYEDTCAACVARYEGYVYQSLGDGIVAFFGFPLAHEGEAERAVHAELAILDALAQVQMPEVDRIAVRIGIATGLVVVSAIEKGAIGETMNLASRLQGIAPINVVVLSERARRLAGGAFVYRDLGPQTLKGLPDLTPDFLVLGASDAASRFEASTQMRFIDLVGGVGGVSPRQDRATDGRGVRQAKGRRALHRRHAFRSHGSALRSREFDGATNQR